MKGKIKIKLLAIILLIALFFENITPVFAVTSSGGSNWVSWQFDSFIYTTDDYNLGVLMRRLVNYDTGEMITAFCAEHFIDSPNGMIEWATHSAPTDESIKYACKIAYFGWFSKYGGYVIDENISYDKILAYVFTQQYIWEYLGQSSGHFIDGNIQNQYLAYRTEIYNNINSIAVQPSFSFDTITLQVGETKVLTDTNGVLKDYNNLDVTTDGIRITHTKGKNTMSIYVSPECTLEQYRISTDLFKSWGMIKDVTQDYDTTIYFTFRNGVQNQIYAMHYNDPVSMRLSLEINQFGSLELSKLDTNGELIDGSTFTVIGENYEQDVVVTGGKIRVDNLKPGIYQIFEKNAPYGYIKDTNTYSAQVTSNNVTTQAITNKEVTGEFRLKKKGKNNVNLAGVNYHFWSNNGYDNTKFTDSNGEILLTNLKRGIYYYQEINSIEPYIIDSTIYSFEIKYKDDLTEVVYESATLTNDVASGTFELFKKNAQGDALQNVDYEVWNNNGFYREMLTNSSGVIRLENLELGRYFYREKNSVYGYLLDPNTYSFDIEYQGQNVSVIYETATKINNEPTGQLTINKWNKDKSARIGNVTIKLWNDNIGYSNIITTKANEPTIVSGLKLGTYHYKELSSVEGYLLDDTEHIIELKYKDQFTSIIYGNIDMTNDEPTGEIRLEKTDIDTGNQNRIDGTSHHGDSTLNQTTYTLYAEEDIYNKAKTIKFFSKNEEIGKYVFDNYGVATASVTNINTIAEIYAENDTIKGLPLGKYYAKETYSSEGYQLDVEKHIYNIKYKDDKTEVITIYDKVENKVDKAKFEVIKISSNDNKTAKVVPNARFCAILTRYVNYYGSFDEAMKHISEYAEDEYSIFTTGENGHGMSSFLAYGNYTVNEIEVPENLNKVETFYVDIDKNSDGVIKELIENDTEFDSYLKIRKVDKDTGKAVTLSNATFTLSILNENNEWEKVTTKTGKQTYDTWTTDEEGVAYTEEKLKSGTYKADEIKIPTGFLKLSEAIIFTINNKNETLEYDNDFDAYITITAENEKPKGTIEVIKNINLRENVDTSLIEIDYTKIKFRLLAKDNIIDYADGKIIYASGEEILTFNLNENGTYTISEVPLGLYELEELQTIDGAILDDTKYEIEISQKDIVTKVYTITQEISNDTTLFEFSKTDITGDKELVGATLQVIDVEDNEIVDEWVSKEETHKIEGLIAEKTYILREKIAVNGYVKANDVTFYVLNTNKIQKVKMIDKVVDVSKQDIAGEEIVGAKLQVLDLDKNIIDEWTSTSIPHRVSGLEENKTYILHEEISADGFVKASDIEFKVSDDKETEHIIMIDKIVFISKVDITSNEEIEGAELIVIDEDENVIDSWISTKEPHIVYGLEEGKTYTLIEKSAPYGYEIAESIEFKVTEEKENQIITMEDKPILTNLKLVKKDSKTKEIIREKFVFGLYSDEKCEELVDKYNSEDGVITFEELRYSTLYIKELVPPNKYSLSDEIVKIEINDKGVFVNDIELNEENNEYSFEFYNDEKPNPDTRSGTFKGK